MGVSGDGRVLSCGAEVGPLVDQVAEGTPPSDPVHQVGCRHCHAALDELASLWGEVRELAREQVAFPTGVVERVMRQIRAEGGYRAPLVPLEAVVPRLIRHALLTGERGTTQIADSVIVVVVRRAALNLAGVHSLRAVEGVDALVGRLSGQTGVGVGVDGHRATVALAIVVVYGYAIPEVVRAVRDRVASAIEQLAGLEVAAIDIRVVDVQTRD